MELTRNAGDRILPLLERAKEELTVYSPFISPKYAKTLVEKSESGTDVAVFTAKANADYHRKSLQILQEGPEIPTIKRNAGLTLTFLGIVGILVACFLKPVVLAPSILSLAGGGYLLKRHLDQAGDWPNSHGKIDVQIVEGLHAKLYSRDNGEEVVFGSVNLTNSGMERNLEVVSECRNKALLQEGESNDMYA